jgi:hypothetical protein
MIVVVGVGSETEEEAGLYSGSIPADQPSVTIPMPALNLGGSELTMGIGRGTSPEDVLGSRIGM